MPKRISAITGMPQRPTLDNTDLDGWLNLYVAIVASAVEDYRGMVRRGEIYTKPPKMSLESTIDYILTAAYQVASAEDVDALFYEIHSTAANTKLTNFYTETYNARRKVIRSSNRRRS